MINIMYTVDPIKRIVKPVSGHAVTEQDHEASSLRFAFPDNIPGTGLESTGTAVRVMYIRPDGGDPVAKTLTFYKHSGGYYLYDWNLQKSDLQKEGRLVFSLCILDISSGEVSEWHTTPCQIRVLDTIHTDDSDEEDETITPTVAQRVAVLETMIQRVASGAPIVVSSVSAMTDTERIYVLTTDGKWYYHDGSAWTAGGEYGGVAVGSVTTDKLANKSVTTAKLDDSSVTRQKLASGAVHTGELADGAVTNVKLADSSVSEEKLASSAVTATKLADGAVTTAKIADGAVAAAKIASGVIPAVDATLAQTGAAADAKKTGDELADLKSTLDLSTPYNAYLDSILCPDYLQIMSGRRLQKKGFTVSIKWVSSNTSRLLWFFTGNESLVVTNFGTINSVIPTSDQIVPIDGLKKLPLNLVYYIDSIYEGGTPSQLFIHYFSVSGDEKEIISAVGITNVIMTKNPGLGAFELNAPEGATHFALSYYSGGAGAAATVTLGLERNYSDEIAKLQALALENA